MKGQTEGRTVVLHPKAQYTLQAWLRHWQARQSLHPSLYLFPSHKGTNCPISRIQAWQLLQQAFQACGMTGRLGTHSLRKTFAQHVYQTSQRNLLMTQKALGHKWVTTTQAYLSVEDAEIEAVILAM
jgi:site-specific recombinase XerD